MADIVLKNVKKIYPASTGSEQAVVAVQDFSLRIADKEFVVLVGPSGCGKSTVLRMIAGLEELTEGELFLDGENVSRLPARQRKLAMVFQNYALFPHMNVYDNMAFALKMQKLPRREIDRRVREAAELLELSEYLRRKPRALSGGQRQRVAIGRAIVCDAQAYLMDEPLSNLDAKLRSQMRAELMRLRRKLDGTFVYVTHDQAEAMTLGDRIVVMKDGLIQQVGTPAEVYAHPANLFVAGFIGLPAMNILPGAVVRKSEGGYGISFAGHLFPLAAEQQLTAGEWEDQELILGIRPAQVCLGEEGLSACVTLTEHLGSEAYVHLALGEQEIVAVVKATEAPKPGTQCHVSFPPASLRLFDPASERSIF